MNWFFFVYLSLIIKIIYCTESICIFLPHPGYEFDFSPEPDLLSLTETQSSPPQLEKILQELIILRLFLQRDENDGMAQKDWLALCYKVDKLLFRIYLLIFTIYSSTILLLWSSWSSAWSASTVDRQIGITNIPAYEFVYLKQNINELIILQIKARC